MWRMPFRPVARTRQYPGAVVYTPPDSGHDRHLSGPHTRGPQPAIAGGADGFLLLNDRPR